MEYPYSSIEKEVKGHRTKYQRIILSHDSLEALQLTKELTPYFFLPTLPAPAQIKKVINDTGFPPTQKFYKITLVHFLWHVLLIPTILFLGKNHLLIDELMAFLFDFSTVITGSIDTGSTFYNFVDFCLLLYRHLHEIVFLLIHTFSDTLHRE